MRIAFLRLIVCSFYELFFESFFTQVFSLFFLIQYRTLFPSAQTIYNDIVFILNQYELLITPGYTLRRKGYL